MNDYNFRVVLYTYQIVRVEDIVKKLNLDPRRFILSVKNMTVTVDFIRESESAADAWLSVVQDVNQNSDYELVSIELFGNDISQTDLSCVPNDAV